MRSNRSCARSLSIACASDTVRTTNPCSVRYRLSRSRRRRSSSTTRILVFASAMAAMVAGGRRPSEELVTRGFGGMAPETGCYKLPRGSHSLLTHFFHSALTDGAAPAKGGINFRGEAHVLDEDSGFRSADRPAARRGGRHPRPRREPAPAQPAAAHPAGREVGRADSRRDPPARDRATPHPPRGGALQVRRPAHPRRACRSPARPEPLQPPHLQPEARRRDASAGRGTRPRRERSASTTSTTGSPRASARAS